MSKDKKEKTEEKKKTDDKSADVKVEKSSSAKTMADKKEEKKSSKDVKKDAKPEAGKVSGLEDLPEDIVKKLEKKKAEASGKAKQKKRKTVKKKKKVPRQVSIGKAYIKATYNNTIVTLTDMNGNVLSWASAGVAGFKGPKKSTPYAAQIISRLAVGKARQEFGLKEVSVFVKGVGTGRESAVRSLNNNGLIVTSIKDVTPVPHNGCRPKRPRRV